MLVPILTYIFSITLLLISFVCDIIEYRKPTFQHQPTTVYGFFLRLFTFVNAVTSLFYIPTFEKYGSFVEQKIAIQNVFAIVQLTTGIFTMSLLGLLFHYWLSMAPLLPTAKIVNWFKIRNDMNPLILPVSLSILYCVYLGFMFGPLLVWSEQKLRLFFWMQLVQSTMQFLSALLVLPVILNLFTVYIVYQSTKRAQKNDARMDNISFALLRVIFISTFSFMALIWTPMLNLVLDPTLIFQSIPSNHPIYSRPCPKFSGWYYGLVGAVASLTSLGKYLKLRQNTKQPDLSSQLCSIKKTEIK
ncbi:hypothetical protein BC833DRAFT_625018 [Globomyces pollinis-pini]|nr:hypothetical protein BC833DRAFT_625018 [Globomyces pollinis-pini]